MKALIISDKEYRTELFAEMNRQVQDYLKERDFQIEEVPIGRDDLAFCKGCFGCWVKKPGECVISDKMAEINQSYIASDVVFYLTPIVFGQFSANIKNSIDRWLPNVLPFFRIKSDGNTTHPPRYNAYPKHIMVGYGEQLSGEDTQTFIDITKNHRSNAEVLIFADKEYKLADALDRIELKKEGGVL
jgi:multimeric flavodoxin WrbA